jgi:AcrR family transcriptional regulator
MASINVARRAEIGQEKRARTRSELLAAVYGLIAGNSIDSITVDDIVVAAGFAKGTFYSHFDDLNDIFVAVADGLIETFDELIHLQRQSLQAPAMRIAFGCACFIEKAIDDPSWGAVVGRMAAAYPSVGAATREKLRDDLRNFLKEDGAAPMDVALAVETVESIVLGILGALANGRLRAAQGRAAVEIVLRALGAKPGRIRKATAEVRRIIADRNPASTDNRADMRKTRRSSGSIARRQ